MSHFECCLQQKSCTSCPNGRGGGNFDKMQTNSSFFFRTSGKCAKTNPEKSHNRTTFTSSEDLDFVRISSILIGFFRLRGRLRARKSVTILVQSRQSWFNTVQPLIVKCWHNPFQSQRNRVTHRRIVPKTVAYYLRLQSQDNC